MPLTAGTHVGSYEILAPIGAGGMGEVYKARDSKLKRYLALVRFRIILMPPQGEQEGRLRIPTQSWENPSTFVPLPPPNARPGLADDPREGA
jgi:serine/threonine protein kinase